jgi:pimeloyl-ACP methyl ester carboxylesterase
MVGGPGATTSANVPAKSRSRPISGPYGRPLEGYGGPITLIRGSRGFVNEDQVAELGRRIPTVDVRTVETGHNVQEEGPVGLAALLEGLLRD